MLPKSTSLTAALPKSTLFKCRSSKFALSRPAWSIRSLILLNRICVADTDLVSTEESPVQPTGEIAGNSGEIVGPSGEVAGGLGEGEILSMPQLITDDVIGEWGAVERWTGGDSRLLYMFDQHF